MYPCGNFLKKKTVQWWPEGQRDVRPGIELAKHQNETGTYPAEPSPEAFSSSLGRAWGSRMGIRLRCEISPQRNKREGNAWALCWNIPIPIGLTRKCSPINLPIKGASPLDPRLIIVSRGVPSTNYGLIKLETRKDIRVLKCFCRFAMCSHTFFQGSGRLVKEKLLIKMVCNIGTMTSEKTFGNFRIDLIAARILIIIYSSHRHWRSI